MYTFTRITNHFPLRLLSCTWTFLTEKWGDHDVENVFWSLHRNDRDGAFLRCGGGVLAEAAGVCYLIPPGCRYDYGCEGTVQHLWVCFDVLGFSPGAVRHLFPEPFALFLSPLAEDLIAAVAAHPQSEVSLVPQWRCMAALTEGLTCAIESLPPERLEGVPHLTKGETPVAAALQHIEANLAESLPNRELATRCSMSEDHFIRRFRASVGQTPAQYVQEARVKAAAELLLFSNLSLEEIAARVGFGSRHYFSRVFSQQTGIGPASYRKVRGSVGRTGDEERHR